MRRQHVTALEKQIEGLSRKQDGLLRAHMEFQDRLSALSETLGKALGKIVDLEASLEESRQEIKSVREPAPVAVAPAPLERRKAPAAKDLWESAKPREPVHDDSSVLELIRSAIAKRSVDVFLQPVVTLPQRQTCFYEISGRLALKGGKSLPPRRYLEVAERHNLSTALDRVVLEKCLSIAGQSGQSVQSAGFFLNVSPSVFRDRPYINALLTVLGKNRFLARQIIFEMRQSACQTLSEGPVLRVMEGLSRLGCRFSMDHVQKPHFPSGDPTTRYLNFVKLDASRLLTLSTRAGGAERALSLKRHLARSGIRLIVEKIEQEQDLSDLVDCGLDYAQGRLFGLPEPFSRKDFRNIA